MTLPEAVVQHLEAAAAEGKKENEHEEPKSLLASLGTMLRKLIEMASTSADVKSVEGCDEQDCGSYGYPMAPAYGVPHNVAVQLLQRAFALLSKIAEVDEIDDAIDAEVAALLKDIASALGLQAEAEPAAAKRLGTWQLIQKAFEATIPTEPLVTPSQAADALEKALEEFGALATKSSRTGERVYLAVLNLRTAVRQAVRVLRTIAQDQVTQVVEITENQTAEQPAQETQPEESNGAVVEQAAATSSDAQDEVRQDDVYVERLNAIERQIEELRQVVEQLMHIPVIRQRATMFAASDEGKPKTAEEVARTIRERYFSTRNELEKRALMREAERLIAESFLSL